LTHTSPPRLHTLPLHDALPISGEDQVGHGAWGPVGRARNFPARAVSEQAVSVAVKHWRQYPTVSRRGGQTAPPCLGPTPSVLPRSEEHTSELQSREKLVCRLLL